MKMMRKYMTDREKKERLINLDDSCLTESEDTSKGYDL